MKISFLVGLLSLGSLLVICNLNLITFAQPNSTHKNDSTTNATIKSNEIKSQPAEIKSTSVGSIPSAQSVYDTGVMSLPASVKGVIIFIPDEAHHPPEDDKTI